jgi:hypothetical protein
MSTHGADLRGQCCPLVLLESAGVTELVDQTAHAGHPFDHPQGSRYGPLGEPAEADAEHLICLVHGHPFASADQPMSGGSVDRERKVTGRTDLDM